MTTNDELHETDDRFPTGEWTGFYIQPDGRQRYVMDLFLQFAQQNISGSGRDLIGEFSISGSYDLTTAECSWTKQYLGQHGVEYTGRVHGRGIIGEWRIEGLPASWSGPFFIWPRAFGDLESAFERAFLEFELRADRSFALLKCSHLDRRVARRGPTIDEPCGVSPRPAMSGPV